jgi:repressor LexA
MQNRYTDAHEATVALLREFPHWRGVISAALEEAKTITSDRFAGKWVLDRAKKHGVNWIPNLRKLVSYGILKKEGESTRGGARAYYSMPDTNGVEQALKEVTISSVNEPYATHEVTGDGVARRSTLSVPFYATLASCGAPNMSDVHIDDYIEVDARLTKPGYDYFLVRAEGDSMDQAGINSGDLLLVRAQDHADFGQKVLACVDGGVTVKEFQHAGEYSILVPRSTNPENKPIVLAEGAQIQGVIVAIIPKFS